MTINIIFIINFLGRFSDFIRSINSGGVVGKVYFSRDRMWGQAE